MSEAGAGDPTALGDEELRRLDAYWRAANFLSVGQIYLLDNPLLRDGLAPEHVKPRLLGHFGTAPGLNLVYAHMNRAIRERDLDAIFVTGPGHGGPANVANAYLEGTYAELYPGYLGGRRGATQAVPTVLVSGRHPEPRGPGDARLDPRGRRARLCARPRVRRGLRQSRPGRRLRRRRRGGRDRAAGGELALEQVPQPALRRRRAAGPAPERLQDREPDGPCADPGAASSWLCSKATAGSRCVVTGGFDGEDPAEVHRRFAVALDEALDRIAEIRARARAEDAVERPRWPMLVLRTPKGWTGPKEVDGTAGGGDMALPPGAARGGARQPGAPAAARGVAPQLPARGAVRRERPPGGRAPGARARRSPADERQPPRERRRASPRPRAARLPRVRGRGTAAGQEHGRGDAGARRLPPRRHRPEPRTSVSSAPTRRPPTGSTPSSRSRDEPGSVRPSRPTRSSG